MKDRTLVQRHTMFQTRFHSRLLVPDYDRGRVITGDFSNALGGVIWALFPGVALSVSVFNAERKLMIGFHSSLRGLPKLRLVSAVRPT